MKFGLKVKIFSWEFENTLNMITRIIWIKNINDLSNKLNV